MSAALQKGAALPCDMERLVEVGRRHGVAVIEDAACAIGSEILWDERWEKIGRPHGDVACFSFHPLKLVSTGDGGMLTTQNPEWDAQFRLLRQHAMSVPTTVRYGSTHAYAELARRQELPWSEQAQDECILLPLYAQMSDREQLEVVDALREAVLRR